MNMGSMKTETAQLVEVEPTKFVSAYCSFWMGALSAFERNLPDNHKKENKISVEAVEAFKRCFGREPTVRCW